MEQPEVNQEVQPVQSITEIVNQYRGRNLYDPRAKRSYSQKALDKYEDLTFTPVIYTPEPEQPKFINADEFLKYLREATIVYKNTHNIKQLYTHPENVQTIKDIAAWACGDIDGKFDPTKGLYIYGKHGSGKTDFVLTLVNTMTVLSRKYDNIFKFKPYSYNAMYEAIRSGNIDILTRKESQNIYMDDFLYQDKNEARVYGNNDRVADLVVTRMYELFKAGYMHIMTSNYPYNQINQDEDNPNLHPGSMDRLTEMFNFIYWKGESLRK